MTTKELFRSDSYLKTCEAKIIAIDERGVQFNQSVLYPHGGGQLGDQGLIVLSSGDAIDITDTQKDKNTGEQLHLIDETQSATLTVGDIVNVELNWERRCQLMRFHTCLHLLCAIIDAPVNGGSIQLDRARLDFDLKEPLDKVAITEQLNAHIKSNAAVSFRWISDAELDAQPDLVRTMSVAPPRNADGTIRLVEIDGIDLQACGGTHVAATGEIGPVMVRKIENKGKQNRRITVVAAGE